MGFNPTPETMGKNMGLNPTSIGVRFNPTPKTVGKNPTSISTPGTTEHSQFESGANSLLENSMCQCPSELDLIAAISPGRGEPSTLYHNPGLEFTNYKEVAQRLGFLPEYRVVYSCR